MKGKLISIPHRGKAQIQYGTNQQTRQFPLDSLPEEIRARLGQYPGGVRVEFEQEEGFPKTDKHNKALVWRAGTERPDFQMREAPPPPAPASLPPQHTPGGYRGGRQAGGNQVHTIQAVRPAEKTDETKFIVTVTPPVQLRRNQPAVSEIESEQFHVTDPALGLVKGNQCQKADPGLKVSQFGDQIPGFKNQRTGVDSNPYNFVAFAGDGPWNVSPSHPDHSRWGHECFTGVIRFQATALTPVFVPAGFPCKVELGDRTPRHFSRMKNAENELCYAIPGSSLKGVLRSAVEALANSRCGELNTDFYKKPIPYRRRSYQAGIVTQQNSKGWDVRGVSSVPPRSSAGQQRSHKRDLLGAVVNGKCPNIRVQSSGKTYFLPGAVVKTYLKNLEHEHYRKHFENYKDKYEELASLPSALEGLKKLDGELIYFTTGTNGEIDSFGKNVNYLWPSKHSIQQLADCFFPKDDLSLKSPLGLAEQMFGFASKHKHTETSGLFRGKLRLETLWGPEAQDFDQEREWPLIQNPNGSGAPGCKIELAPLTAPQTRAKSRPLYLVGSPPNGRSASYSDSDPQLKGRKFYWHQTSDSPGRIWPKHLYDTQMHESVKKQCPPPLLALNADATFTGAIHFDNLSPEELGVLLYTLQGDGRYHHALKVGKAKPRGLGSMQISVTALELRVPEQDYRNLLETPQSHDAKPRIPEYVKQFEDWCVKQSGGSKSFEQLPHIRDYDALHAWPENRQAPCYYPLNFADYSWLPDANKNPDEPKGGPAQRPRAMKCAREIRTVPAASKPKKPSGGV